MPDASDIKARLNRLKGREFYRPVAPMIASEALEAVFGAHRSVESPYMSMAPAVLPKVTGARRPRARRRTARHQSCSETSPGCTPCWTPSVGAPGWPP